MSQTPASNHYLCVNDAQLNVILAAMRYWQRAAESGRVSPQDDEIAADGGQALTVDEYDSFIEELNGGCAPPPTFIATVTRLLATSESLDVRLSKSGEDLQVLVIPKLGEAKDEDEPGVAAFRALLARPVKTVVPAGQNPDEVLAALFAEHSALHAEVANDLDAHRNQLTEARQAAQTARDEAAKAKTPVKASSTPAKASKPGKGGKVVAKRSSAAPAAGEAPSTVAAEAAPAPTPEPKPAPCGTPSLFSDLGF